MLHAHHVALSYIISSLIEDGKFKSKESQCYNLHYH